MYNSEILDLIPIVTGTLYGAHIFPIKAYVDLGLS